jgi:tripartite motif-containing protein 71
MRRLLFVSVLLLPLLAVFAPPADAATGDLIKTWNTPAGKGPGKLGFIYGLALDPHGNVWVADTSNDRIQRFSGSGKPQKLIKGNLDTPEGIAVGPDQRIYVTDSLHDKIKVFGKGGALKLKWGSFGDGRYGFHFTADVEVGPDGAVYVVDKQNDKVKKYDSQGKWLATFKNIGLSDPNGVALDSSGNIYIADRGNNRVVVLDAGGNLIDEWGTGAGPSMLTVHDGFLYVTNGQGTFPNGSQVQKFETDGDFVDNWEGPDGMSSPCGIAATPNGKILVAEFGNQRVQKFEG